MVLGDPKCKVTILPSLQRGCTSAAGPFKQVKGTKKKSPWKGKEKKKNKERQSKQEIGDVGLRR